MRIGIDFGTTFSLPGCIVNNAPVTLLPSGEYGVPSLFYYDSEVGMQIGAAAEENGAFYPANMIRDIKMDIRSPHNAFTIDGRTFSKKEIVGSILREIVRLSQEECSRREYLSQKIDGAMISVPAAFTLRELAFIREAAEMTLQENGAGLHVLGFIREPVAAAIAYFNAPNAEDDMNILVYDLGGGTCDIALVRSDKHAETWYSVLDSEMERIGGRDWDQAVVGILKRKFKEKFNVEDFDQKTDEKIYRQAVSAKELLSRTSTARIQVEIGGAVLSCVITIDEFEEATKPLLNKTLDMVSSMMKKNKTKVQYIVCVGGSSNMPQVKKALVKKYPHAQVKIYEPEKAIAFGAAIFAEHLSENQFLRDICKFSYGVRFVEDYEKYHDKERYIIENMIYKDSPLPASGTTSGRQIEDGGGVVYYAIFESTCTDKMYDPANGTLIGDVQISGLIDLKKGDRSVTTLSIDKFGLLHAKTMDVKTNRTAVSEIQLLDF